MKKTLKIIMFILFVIFLASVFIIFNPFEKESVKNCKKAFQEYIYEQQIKSPVDFGYSIIEIRKFNSTKKINEYINKWYTTDELLSGFLGDYYLCEKEINNTIAILYKTKTSDRRYTGKTMIFICDENGNRLKICQKSLF